MTDDQFTSLIHELRRIGNALTIWLSIIAGVLVAGALITGWHYHL
jgi:hypothetical protein